MFNPNAQSHAHLELLYVSFQWDNSFSIIDKSRQKTDRTWSELIIIGDFECAVLQTLKSVHDLYKLNMTNGKRMYRSNQGCMNPIRYSLIGSKWDYLKFSTIYSCYSWDEYCRISSIALDQVQVVGSCQYLVSDIDWIDCWYKLVNICWCWFLLK